MIADRTRLQPGTRLVATYKKERYQAEVKKLGDATVIVLGNNRGVFKSLSSAGTAITEKACNGWTFWSIDDDRAPAKEEAVVEEQPVACKRKRATETNHEDDGHNGHENGNNAYGTPIDMNALKAKVEARHAADTDQATG